MGIGQAVHRLELGAMNFAGKGRCALILLALALIGALVAYLIGAPWYGPLIGFVLGPIVAAVVAGVVSLLFLADGMGR